jgi:NADH-quinone oxidoreductase subunit F
MSENLSHWLGRTTFAEESHQKVLLQRIHEIIDEQRNKKERVFLGSEQIQILAKEFNVAPSVVTGVLSAYDFLKPENLNKKIYVCNGSSCLCAGKQDKVISHLQNLIPKSQEETEIGHISCLGRCHEAGSFLYQDQTYSGNDYLNFKLNDKKENLAKVSVGTLSKETILTPQPVENLKEFYSDLKGLNKIEFLKQIKESKLRGRGGAGFPFGLKLESYLNSVEENLNSKPNTKKYIVCNADEGDPGAFTDKYLLEEQSHLVLWGMAACGMISGAEKGYIYLRYEYPETNRILQKTIAEISEYSLPFKIEIVRGFGSYVCGEETALLNSLEGQRPEVRLRPPYPTVEGLFACPTLLSNVESFANLKFISAKGGLYFSKVGTATTSGTKLVSLDVGFNKPGVYEVDMGTPISTIIEKIGGGFAQPTKALHIGGPLGGIVPIELAKKLNLDFNSFSDGGFLLGHASFVCIPEKFSMIDYVLHLFEFVKNESCGKCFPCRLGSDAGFKMWAEYRSENKKISFEEHTKLLNALELGSLCALGGGLPLPIKNALKYFEAEFKDCFKAEERGN